MMRPGAGAARQARINALAGFVLLVVASAPVHGQLEVDLLEVKLQAGPNAVSGTFAVRNTSDAARTVRLELADWDRTEAGDNRFMEYGRVAGSCGGSLEVFPGTLQLAPGEVQPVRVTYVGAERDRSCWAAVSVTTAPSAVPSSGGVQLMVTVQHMVKVYVDPPGGRPGVELADLDIETRRAGDMEQNQVTVEVRNGGTVQARVRGRVEYRTFDDRVVKQQTVPDLHILPDAVRRFSVDLPELPPGRYVILVLLDYGGADIVAGQLELEIG